MDPKFLSYYNFALSYAYTLCKDREHAKDLVQEVYVNFIRKNTFIQDPNYKAFLTTCIKNHFLNSAKKSKKVLDVSEYIEALKEEEIDEELLNKLSKAMKKLPEYLIKVIEQYYIKGLSVKKISELENVPPCTIGTRLFYARKKLKLYISNEKRIRNYRDKVVIQS